MANALSGIAILDALPEAALVIAPDGTVRYANRAATDMLGYDAKELEGRPISHIIVPQSGQRIDVVAWLERWANEPHSPQLRYLTLTGRTGAGAELRLSVRVARMEQPELRYLITMRDVTAEFRERLDVKHAHLVASRILAISDDAIVNADADQRITFFNRKAESLFGYRADEVLGKPLSCLLPERLRAKHAAHVAEFRQGPHPSRLMGERGEIVGLTKSGEEIPFEASITKVFIDGAPVFSAHLRDIRARKAAERALQESEQRFRTVFVHAFEAIALLDAAGTVLELNDAAQRLIPGEARAVGQKFWTLPWWPHASDDERERRRTAMQEALRRCAAGEDIRTRAELADAEGAVHVIDFSLRPVRTLSEVAAIVAEGRDITALVGGS